MNSHRSHPKRSKCSNPGIPDIGCRLKSKCRFIARPQPKLIIVLLKTDPADRNGSRTDHTDHTTHLNAHGATEDPLFDGPLNMIHMAQVLEAASQKNCHCSDAFAGNSRALLNDSGISTRPTFVLRPMPGVDLLSYHAAFGYFADAYGLKQLAIENEGKSPSARKIADMLGQSKEQMIACMLIQPQFDTPPIRRLASRIGLPAEVVDPLSADSFGIMERLRSVLLNHHSIVLNDEPLF